MSLASLSAAATDRAIDAAVCVIGAGAAGIALALDLRDAGVPIVVLDAGPAHGWPMPEALVVDGGPLARASALDGRSRGLGGSTRLWAGQALPLSELDLADRDWVALSGWPLTRAELEPFYRRAERVLGLPTAGYGAADWPARSPRPPALDDAGIELRWSQFAPRPDLGALHRAELERAARVEVLLDAEVVAIAPGADGVEVAARSATGRRATVRADHVVLCAGGIDTPRLLLEAAAAAPAAFAAASPMLGRCFQEHLHLRLPFDAVDERRLRLTMNTRRSGGVRRYPKLAASAGLQRRERILGAGADLCYAPSPDDPVEAAKALVRAVRDPALRRDAPRTAARVARSPGALARAGWAAARHGHKVSEATGRPHLCLQVEMAPRPENRVTLTDDGGTRLELAPREQERHTAAVFAAVLDEALARAGVGRLAAAPPEDPEAFAAAVVPGLHHMGATRMHADPELGVVDPEGRVHGVDRLWVASASTFPTSGFSNPTLTLLALTLRLADRLRSEL